MCKNKYFSFVVCMLLCSCLFSCDKYVQPSPFDGIWRVERYEAIGENKDIVFPNISVDNPEYWRFNNILFSHSAPGQKYIQGLILVNKDVLTLSRNDHPKNDYSKVPWPQPDASMSPKLQFRYKVWKGRLKLYTKTYAIYLLKV